MKIFITRLLLALTFSLSFNAALGTASAQGTTAFTYQGQLHDSGTNANGNYAMIFALYDAGTNGNQIGSPITTSATLANGLFSVNLDFGAGAFSGTARWLDITVTNGGAAQTLSPRVQVLPVPYALYAGTAGNVTNGAITTAQIAGGQVVRTLNGLTDNVILAAGANTSLSTNGNTLQLSASVPNIQKFNSSGTFVVPTNVNRIMVEAWGGGGGGGNCSSATNSAGGGGAGEYTLKSLTVTPGASYTVTVGSGGSADGAGGTSSFDVLVSVGGGSAGGDGTDAAAGLSGLGGGSGKGAPGQAGFYQHADIGGNGGNAIRGGNGGWGNQDYKNAQAPGGGGGGGVADVQSGAGGTGGQGEVIVYY